MKSYERIFGAGPRGAIISILLLLVTYFLQESMSSVSIFTSDAARYPAVSILCSLGLILITWSLVSLPPGDRGRSLVTTGAFVYFRHPLYASFLLFFNPAIALYLNDMIYLFWVIILFPVWSLNVRSEERLMSDVFGKAYDEYCKNTAKFIPKVW
ncbi:MAG TPA: isoprenylcysteine carboxylmethyltransferase family protein [Gammaproteobacteria bacterium]